MAGLDAETVPEIAVLLGYDETTIRRILKGSLQVSVSLLKVLKKHVGLDEALRICNLADKDEAA
jgi:predicted transcriptional regulator